MKFLVHLLNSVLLVVAWAGAFIALHFLALWLMETRSFPPGQDLPFSFYVVVEKLANGSPAAWEARRYLNPTEFKLDPGESLHLSVASYDQFAQGVGGNCCIDFKVLEDGPEGQLIELNNDDMTYIRTRYRVRDGKVTPVSHRMDYSLYYLGYFLLGGLLAWLATRPLRRRLLAWAQSRAA